MSLRLPLALPSHDDLSRLAREDPPAFEALRRQLIDTLIDSAPEKNRPRLRGIQFRVECLRRLSRSALGSTVRIYELMWESFLDLNDNCQALVEQKRRILSGTPAAADDREAARRSARIFEFRPASARPAKQERVKK